MEQHPHLHEPSPNRRPVSSASTPFASAACSPRTSTDQELSCFFSASTPASPVEVTLTGIDYVESLSQVEDTTSEDFDFSARFSEADQLWASTPMSSADELFCNGQIRPLWHAGDDLYQVNFTQLEHDGDSENDHYFRSSADYKFSMLLLQQSYASATDTYGLSSRYHDHHLWAGKVMNDVTEEAFSAQTTADSLPRQSSRRQDAGMVVKPAVKVKGDGGRGRRIGGGSIRRTRSLSPLRVFHMDDDHVKQSIETQSVTSLEDGNAGKAAEYTQKGEVDEITRNRVRVTLKDLLCTVDKGENGFTRKISESSISSKHRKSHLEGKVREGKPKLSPKKGLEHRRKLSYHNHTDGAQGSASPHGQQFSSVHPDPMRRQTFLPYRHGLLACLGFSSKGYRSVAGMRSFQSKSQGKR